MQAAIRRRQFAEILQWFSKTRTDGLLYGPDLLAMKLPARREFFERTPEALTVGTLEFLLDAAHKDLDDDPPNALELTSFVLDYADLVTGPGASGVPLLLFSGRAYKEHANALRTRGNLPAALTAANRAVQILSQNGACRPELASVRMLQATIQNQMGQRDAALRVIRESASEFQAERDSSRYIQAKILEGVFLFDDRTREAADLWEALLPEAARLQDPREMARICSNLWVAAGKLGDPDLAQRYYKLAAELYDEAGMEAEKPRLRWGYARVLAKQGNPTAALREYEYVRNEMLERRMLADAAQASLETLELLQQLGRGDEAIALAAELLNQFSQRGMAPHAQEAWRFLERRAREKRLNERDVRVVREYYKQIEKRPELEFDPTQSPRS